MARLVSEKLLEEKIFKRRRANKKYDNDVSQKNFESLRQKDLKIIAKQGIKLKEMLSEIGINNFSYTKPILQFPANFTFSENYENTIITIREFASVMSNNLGKTIVLDFSKCKVTETPTLFLLQVLRNEIDRTLANNTKTISTIKPHPLIEFVPSNVKAVNRLLYLSSILSKEDYESCKVLYNEEFSDLLEPIDRTGYLRGSKKQNNFNENKKSLHTTTVVKYVNSCLESHDYALNPIGRGMLEGIIAEILNNAEDHGVFNNWYVSANFSKEHDKRKSIEDVVGEMNLVIFNFGRSIYEGLQNTKDKNQEMFQQLIDTKQNLDWKYPHHTFTEDNLFTLYALQDGVSRLKYEDISRGTGTMKFLNSFLHFGDFEDDKKGYKPNLSIYSGQTQLICDNQYKPVNHDNVFSLTLNPENDLTCPPRHSHLKVLYNKFPGTLLSVKIYLSKGHLDEKFK